MKTYNTCYINDTHLSNFIIENHIQETSNILIQIFSGIVDEVKLLKLSSFLKKVLPQASVIGTTTAGEIENGKMYDKTIQVSFSLFDSTLIKSKLFDLAEPFDIQDITDSLVVHNTKALIIFSDGLKSNAEELLNQLTLSNPHIIIAGGRAADFKKFEKTLVFDHKATTENGFVIASLSGDELVVNNEYMLNWNQVGKEMVVTKADGNIIYEIDNIEIKALYEKYLGSEISENLLYTGIEFPLLTVRNGVEVARSPISILEDGSIFFGGNLEVGETVKFAYGNLNDIQNSIYDNNKKFSKLSIESIFIYSCSGRKTLMGKELEEEFGMLNSLAPTVGFFTYGEYFHSAKINEVLNITTTFLALAETPNNNHKEIVSTKKHADNRILKALTHLANVSTEDTEKKNKKLSRFKYMVSKSVLFSTADLKGNIVSISKAYLDFLQLEERDIIGKNHNIFKHPDTPKSFYTKLWQTLNENKRFEGNLKNKRDGEDYWIKLMIEPLLDDKGVKVGYCSYREDITDKKVLEYLSSHDSLTQLSNRTEFTKRVNEKIKSAQRYSKGFAFAICDIDYFKRVNDTYGHKIGDDVLSTLSKCLSDNVRDDDFLARWGGEEFVIITDHTDIEDFILLIKKLQKEISKVLFTPVEKITLSFGLTLYREEDTKESLLKRADKALYMAKANGRNRYEVEL